MSWIQLYNSEFYDFDDPNVDVSNISIETIAHSLANQCRFNGHTMKFYSIAEHSMCVADRVGELSGFDTRDMLYGLMHDASEAILCDIPKPVKILPGAKWYRELETDIQDALVEKFVGMYTKEAYDFTKQADFEMLSTEAQQVMSLWPRDWGYLPDSLPYTLECFSPDEAKELFLDYYRTFKRV